MFDWLSKNDTEGTILCEAADFIYDLSQISLSDSVCRLLFVSDSWTSTGQSVRHCLWDEKTQDAYRTMQNGLGCTGQLTVCLIYKFRGGVFESHPMHITLLEFDQK